MGTTLMLGSRRAGFSETARSLPCGAPLDRAPERLPGNPSRAKAVTASRVAFGEPSPDRRTPSRGKLRATARALTREATDEWP
jgi:hypothetical protein